MNIPPAPISIYATRWKPLLAAVFCAGAIVFDLFDYLVWPIPAHPVHPWEYQEPARTILFVLILLICGAIFVIALYWAVTPRPMLYLDASRFVYHRYPLPTCSIAWEDVEGIAAFVIQRDIHPLLNKTTPILSLSFTLKQRHIGPYTPPIQVLSVDIKPTGLSLRAEELVRIIQQYHPVNFVSAVAKPRPKRRTQGPAWRRTRGRS